VPPSHGALNAPLDLFLSADVRETVCGAMAVGKENSRISHVVGFDDAPFAREHRGDILLIGAVFAGARLDGIISGKVRRDGANSTSTIVRLIENSRFVSHLQLIMLQGIAFAGFNVVDIHMLSRSLGLPVLVVGRKMPDYEKIRKALLARVPGGARKWQLIEQAGPMEPLVNVYVQRAGIGKNTARRVIERFAINSDLPEPVRTAHIVAGGVTLGESRHRA
jgi:endonuclease V-like protein UPF0215 family